MLAVIVTITERFICGVCVSVTIMAMMGRYICSVNMYCDNNGNNGEVFMQC